MTLCRWYLLVRRSSVLLLLCEWTGSHLRVSYLSPRHTFLDHTEVGSGSTLPGDLRGSGACAGPATQEAVFSLPHRPEDSL